MKIRIIHVGKTKETFFQEAFREYEKRLGSYVNLETVETPEEKAPQSLSSKEEDGVREKEGRGILSRIKDKDFVVLLDIQGKTMDSLRFSQMLQEFEVYGRETVDFVIGGSLGVSPEVRDRSDFRLSFGPMTYPHQLMRVLLIEQIYRGYRIMKNHPYHK